MFPADANTAVEALQAAYRTRGQIWTLLVPKREVAVSFGAEQARALIQQGAARLRGTGGSQEKVVLAAVGAYQLAETLKASGRLETREIPHSVVYLIEPARFRISRTCLTQPAARGGPGHVRPPQGLEFPRRSRGPTVLPKKIAPRCPIAARPGVVGSDPAMEQVILEVRT